MRESRSGVDEVADKDEGMEGDEQRC